MTRHSRSRGPRHLALLIGALLLVGAGECPLLLLDPSDPMLHLDIVDPTTGRLAEIVPGTPYVSAGPDGEFDTRDDLVSVATGDVDLALRTGIQSFSGPLPAPSSGTSPVPVGVAEPFAGGVPIEFVVSAVDSNQGPPPGQPVVSPSLEGVPVMVAAFADLDGDGWIGVTHLDGDPLDIEVEESELVPVGRGLAIAQSGRASGSLYIGAGGPGEAPLSVVLGAAAYTGAFDPAFFDGVVPVGPVVMTRLPFLPVTDPEEAIGGGGGVLGPADPLKRPAPEIEDAFVPDPGDPRIREAFTLDTDGSDLSTDTARMLSGRFARLGFGVRPSLVNYRALPGRPLRPALDDAGERTAYEILQSLVLDDDGRASQLPLRVLPLDRLGNVTDLAGPLTAVVRSEGAVRIVSPDLDSDPTVEKIEIQDSRGAMLVIDDLGGVFDDPDAAALVVESASGILRLEVTLPDPDVDDSGLVDEADLALVRLFFRTRLGEPEFEPRYDLDGDGRIRDPDLEVVNSHLGETVPVP